MLLPAMAQVSRAERANEHPLRSNSAPAMIARMAAIGTFRKFGDVRCSVAIEGKADIHPTLENRCDRPLSDPQLRSGKSAHRQANADPRDPNDALLLASGAGLQSFQQRRIGGCVKAAAEA
jgi:hypothetical protein